MGTQGIYAITNAENGKVYIGSTIGLAKRWEYHRQDLRRGDHANPHLQRAWNKYGEAAFEFGILEYLDSPEELHLAEQFWCDVYHEEGKELYNIATVGPAPMLGRKHTEESRQKMSKVGMGRRPTEESRRKMSRTHKGKMLSKETRRRMSGAHKGKKLSEETKRKISMAKKGKRHSRETRQKIGEAQRGRKLSEETRRRISMGLRRYYNND